MIPAVIISGDSPVILGQPHSGTFVPGDIFAQLNKRGQELRDTDWHIPQLYEDLLPGVTIVRANFSRYVIDANRDPSGTSLYPGQNTTSLVPLSTFDEEPIWTAPLTQADITKRLQDYHAPYHAALTAEIARVKSIHGFAILYDCHSIRSEVPFLFEDQLPDLNIGDNGGLTCAPAVRRAVQSPCEISGFSHVINGRFKGGWTTRHYGDPANNVHAIQMEISQRNYLKEEVPPFRYDAQHAEKLRGVLAHILSALSSLSPADLITET